MCNCQDDWDVRCVCQPKTTEILTCPVRVSTMAWIFENDGINIEDMLYFMSENGFTEKDMKDVQLDMVYNVTSEFYPDDWELEDKVKFIERYILCDCNYDMVENICNSLGYLSDENVVENVETLKTTFVNDKRFEIGLINDIISYVYEGEDYEENKYIPKKPSCPHGEECYRKCSTHFEEYLHQCGNCLNEKTLVKCNKCRKINICEDCSICEKCYSETPNDEWF